MRFGQRAQETSGAPLAPLLDVVLLLLIFFVVTTSFAESHLPLTLPNAASGKPGEDAALRVELSADGALLVEGEALKADALALRLAEAHQEERAVEIRADRTTEHHRFVTVLDLARQAGIEAIGIAVDTNVRAGAADAPPALDQQSLR